MEQAISTSNYKLDNDIKICFLVMRETKKFNKKTKKDDEYYQSVAVFEAEQDAEKYYQHLKERNLPRTNFFIVPTPYYAREEQCEEEKKN